MKRRDFLKNSAGAMAAAAFPYILPTGRLFAPTGQRIANHVVFLMFAGGIRNIESVQKAEGNLMPNLLPGNENISTDILDGMEALPNNVFGPPLLSKATLFKEFRYAQGPAGHFEGHTTALTGAYQEGGLDFTVHTLKPSIFEYYRKHNSPSQSALNAWWVSLYTGDNELLSYSTDPNYGLKYAANFLCPNNLLYNAEPIDLCKTFTPSDKAIIGDIRQFLNSAFNNPTPEELNKAINSPENFSKIQLFMDDVLLRQQNGSLYSDWANVTNVMNGDMHNILMAENILQEFEPELLVVNMTNTDTCHRDFTDYCNNLRKADYAAAHLWKTIQATPGLKDDTILIIAPEHGRDLSHNTIVDDFGRYGLDHGGDEVSSHIFCMVVGPDDKVYQNNVITSVTGQSIDIVPTISHILGFHDEIPNGMLQGTPLYQAFV